MDSEMRNPEILLRDILKLKSDLELQGLRLPPGLAGMYGEILAFQKLQKVLAKGKFSVRYFSGQKGADIQLVNGNNKVNIEIKTSRLKDEGFGMWYGVALNIKKCRNKKHTAVYKHPKRGKVQGDFCYFDFVVLVALADDFLEAKYYVIPRSFIERNEEMLRNTHKRFSSATHRIIISDGHKMPDMSSEQKRLVRASEAFQNKWELIRN